MKLRLVLAALAVATPAFAQTEPTPTPASVPMPGTPTNTTTTTTTSSTTDGSTTTSQSTTTATAEPDVTASAAPPADDDAKKKEPKFGDFNAGGQVRLPNGPDENNEYATFNWVALDLKGRFYLLKYITVDGTIPLAVKKPDQAMGVEPSLIGGLTTRLEANVPEIKMMGYKQQVGVSLGAAYMREGAMLLSERDYPLFAGDFKPGFTGGLLARVALASAVDFRFDPQIVYQSGTEESLTALQIPLSLIVKLGDVVKLGTELGIYTGDDYSFGPSNGGRISTGISLDVKIGKLLTHAGVGFASLLTDEMGAYPSIKESMYIDLNVKYAK